MAVDLTWGVVKDVVGWAASAYKAAKGKQEQRYARLVEHAGVLVAGVSRLNRQVVALLGQLRFFEPAEWTTERRADLIRDLILFADESTVVPRMRAARSALRAVIVDVDDRDVLEPATAILELTDLLFEPAARSRSGSTGRLLDHAGAAFHEMLTPAPLDLEASYSPRYQPDAYLSEVLPELIDLLRVAETKEEVGYLRALATSLTKHEDPRIVAFDGRPTGFGSPSAFGALPAHSVLSPYAAGMQDAFGRLIAAQQRVFPAMPVPTWVFD